MQSECRGDAWLHQISGPSQLAHRKKHPLAFSSLFPLPVSQPDKPTICLLVHPSLCVFMFVCSCEHVCARARVWVHVVLYMCVFVRSRVCVSVCVCVQLISGHLFLFIPTDPSMHCERDCPSYWQQNTPQKLRADNRQEIENASQAAIQ